MCRNNNWSRRNYISGPGQQKEAATAAASSAGHPRQGKTCWRRGKSVARVGRVALKWLLLLLCGKRKCSAACKHFHLLSLLFLWRLSSCVSCTFKCKILNYDGSCFSINMASVKS